MTNGLDNNKTKSVAFSKHIIAVGFFREGFGINSWSLLFRNKKIFFRRY
jgi:hypothetical protein